MLISYWSGQMILNDLSVNACQPITYTGDGRLILTRSQYLALKNFLQLGGKIDGGKMSVDKVVYSVGNQFFNHCPRKVTWVGNNSYWVLNMSAKDQLRYALQIGGYSLYDFNSKLKYFSTMTGFSRWNCNVEELVTHERELLSFFRALLFKPKGVVLDNVDCNSQQIRALIEDIESVGVVSIPLEVCV